MLITILNINTILTLHCTLTYLRTVPILSSRDAFLYVKSKIENAIKLYSLINKKKKLGNIKSGPA